MQLKVELYFYDRQIYRQLNISANTIQSALRRWLYKSKKQLKRNYICKAILIQRVIRGYLSRCRVRYNNQINIFHVIDSNSSSNLKSTTPKNGITVGKYDHCFSFYFYLFSHDSNLIILCLTFYITEYQTQHISEYYQDKWDRNQAKLLDWYSLHYTTLEDNVSNNNHNTKVYLFYLLIN